MIWLILGIFLVGPLLAIPFAMAAGKRSPVPEGVGLISTETGSVGMASSQASRVKLVEKKIAVE